MKSLRQIDFTEGWVELNGPLGARWDFPTCGNRCGEPCRQQKLNKLRGKMR